MATIVRVRTEPRGTERKDRWWVEPLTIVLALSAFVVYAFIASTLTTTSTGTWTYFAEPYLSPLFSPCLTSSCPPSERLLPFTIDIQLLQFVIPASYLIVGSPLLFRFTCYYYRRSIYRGFFQSPSACAVPDARKRYTGESRFPFILQNFHRYALYLALIVVVILWIDTVKAFSFPDPANHSVHRLGIGLGSLVMLANVLLLSAYTFGCHALRHLVGGSLDSFHRASLRLRLWTWVTRLNLHHNRWAWISMGSVGFTDLYIRLLAMGVISDPRILF